MWCMALQTSDISSLTNLSQKLIAISHRLFLTVSYNNTEPRQRHWLEGKNGRSERYIKRQFTNLKHK